jgi:hypothetical protein
MRIALVAAAALPGFRCFAKLARPHAAAIVCPEGESCMRLPRRFLLLLLPLLLLLMGARQAPLIDPDPILVPQGLSADAVQREIKRALMVRGWVLTAEQPGQIDATLNLRAHVARARIDFDHQRVRWSYVSSENLAYEEKRGERRIHKNYASWVNNVLTDISVGLQVAANE